MVADAAGVGVADGDRQRVGGVGDRRAGGGQQAGDHEGDLVLVGAAGADQRLLDHLGGVFGDREAGGGGRQHRRGAGVAELQGRGAVGGDEGLLDRRLVGRPGGDDLGDARGRSPAAARTSAALSCGAITPWAMWLSRAPSIATTPQPVRRRPGSRPRMRIAFVMCSTTSRGGPAYEKLSLMVNGRLPRQGWPHGQRVVGAGDDPRPDRALGPHRVRPRRLVAGRGGRLRALPLAALGASCARRRRRGRAGLLRQPGGGRGGRAPGSAAR